MLYMCIVSIFADVVGTVASLVPRKQPDSLLVILTLNIDIDK